MLGKLDTEWGMEIFFNIAVTPWLQVSPDIQYLEAGTPGVDEAMVLARLVRIYFLASSSPTR